MLHDSRKHLNDDISDDELATYVPTDEAIRTIYAFTSLILFSRFLYFFRVLRSTGYYIRMLVEVLKDIVHFLFIFILTIIAFAHAFFVLF